MTNEMTISAAALAFIEANRGAAWENEKEFPEGVAVLFQHDNGAFYFANTDWDGTQNGGQEICRVDLNDGSVR
jgi:hypothetical protein